MLFRIITTAVTFVGLVAAAPLSTLPECVEICQDGIDDCGQMWGG